MPKANFDYAFVSTAQCQPGKSKTDWYDATITGFVLECRSTGGRTYYLRYSDVSGRLRQHKIGRYEDVSFAQAKKKAQQLRSEVVMGGDPRAKKDIAKSIPLYIELPTCTSRTLSCTCVHGRTPRCTSSGTSCPSGARCD